MGEERGRQVEEGEKELLACKLGGKGDKGRPVKNKLVRIILQIKLY